MDSQQDQKTGADRIRDAAIGLFGQHGANGTSLKTVATEAGVSQALVIHHFGSKEKLRAACDELLSRLDAHNSKEEPIIYPQADAHLTPEATQRLHAFLAEGILPEGWRCEKATA